MLYYITLYHIISYHIIYNIIYKMYISRLYRVQDPDIQGNGEAGSVTCLEPLYPFPGSFRSTSSYNAAKTQSKVTLHLSCLS